MGGTGGNGTDDMRDRLEARLAELEAEQDAGRNLLAEMEAKQADLQQTLLRISGAIQVLQELLAPAPTEAPATPVASTP
jgi:uncharacterized coiled-coil protein SlyX